MRNVKSLGLALKVMEIDMKKAFIAFTSVIALFILSIGLSSCESGDNNSNDVSSECAHLNIISNIV